MSSSNGLLAQSPGVLPPLPAQNTLDLLLSYGVPYPGNAAPAPSVELVRLSEVAETETTASEILLFLTKVYPRLKPTIYTSVGISFATTDTADPSIESAIYNFYTITGNNTSDIVPAGTAAPINAVITDLERTYSKYALNFIMNLFYSHMNDITDNPHHDNSTNLLDVWTDFFQILYNKYTTLVGNPVSLETFILNKTTALDLATLSGYTDSSQALFIVPFEVVMALIADHNTATDSSIHEQLQETLSAEITLPIPSLYITPELFCSRYKILSADMSVQSNSVTPPDQIDYFLSNYSSSSAPTLISSLMQIDVPHHEDYYQASSLNDTFPRMNATIFVQANVDITDVNTISIITLTSTTTTNELRIVKIGGEQNNYQINLILDDYLYQKQLDTTSSEVLFALVYSTSGITITYIDQDGNSNSLVEEITNLTLEFDTIQIGIPISYSASSYPNTLQIFSVYPTMLSNDQISLLFNTTLTTLS